jgi:hypothetical protein
MIGWIYTLRTASSGTRIRAYTSILSSCCNRSRYDNSAVANDIIMKPHQGETSRSCKLSVNEGVSLSSSQ